MFWSNIQSRYRKYLDADVCILTAHFREITFYDKNIVMKICILNYILGFIITASSFMPLGFFFLQPEEERKNEWELNWIIATESSYLKRVYCFLLFTLLSKSYYIQ